MDIRKVFGLNMRRLRLAAGLSQEDAADTIGVGRAHASAMERGQQNVTLLILWRSRRRWGGGRGSCSTRAPRVPSRNPMPRAKCRASVAGRRAERKGPARSPRRGLCPLFEDRLLAAGPVGAVAVAFQVLDQDGVDGSDQSREVEGQREIIAIVVRGFGTVASFPTTRICGAGLCARSAV